MMTHLLSSQSLIVLQLNGIHDLQSLPIIDQWFVQHAELCSHQLIQELQYKKYSMYIY